MDQIPAAIRRWMVAHDLSLSQLSVRTNIPKTTLLRRLDHPGNFTIRELERIAAVLGCEVLDLWTDGDGKPNGSAAA